MGPGGSGALNFGEDRAELEALLLLRVLPGAGDRRVGRALRELGTAGKVLSCSRPRFSRMLGGAACQARADTALLDRARGILRRCERLGIEIAPVGYPRYPRSLMALVDPPTVLFLRGDVSFLNRHAVAIVGSRRATAAGRRAAERIAAELSERGVTVVSGLALGIDGAAHRGALAGSGSTIAVLGSGPDRVYPAAHRKLFGQILERGLIVSEFLPGESARPYHFPRRNRIVAGLTAGVVVVEAGERSGALITVDHALDLGIEVCSVPGSIEASQSKGTNHLLRDGAHLVTCGADILEVLGWRGLPPSPGASDPRGGPPPVAAEVPPTAEPVACVGAPTRSADSDLARVSRALGPAPRPMHRLLPDIGLPVERVLASLTRLELQGRVVRGADGWRARGYPR